MATVQRYLNTASTAGGDGTTNATSGGTRAFASQSEAEANMGGSATDDYILDCCGSTADTTAVIIDFPTNLTTGTFLVRGNRSDPAGFYNGNLVISTSHYYLSQSSAFYCIRIQEANVTIDGIQVGQGRSSGDGIQLYAPYNTTVRRCRVFATSTSAYGGIGQSVSLGGASGATILIENNLVVGFIQYQISYWIGNFYNRTVNIYHNTCYCYTNARGIYIRGGPSGTQIYNVKGNAVANSGTSLDIDYSGVTGAAVVNFDTNALQDSEGTTNEIALGTDTDAWTSPGLTTSADFTIKDASSALNATVPGTLVSTDINDVARSSYSIGCFEFAVAANDDMFIRRAGGRSRLAGPGGLAA